MLKLIYLLSVATFCSSQQISVPLQHLQCDGAELPPTAVRGFPGKRGVQGEKGEPCYSLDEYEARDQKFLKQLKSLRKQLTSRQEDNALLKVEINETRISLNDEIDLLEDSLNETLTTLHQYADEVDQLRDDLNETQSTLTSALEMLEMVANYKDELERQFANMTIVKPTAADDVIEPYEASSEDDVNDPLLVIPPLRAVEEETDPCGSNPCGSNRTCSQTDVSPFYSCHCQLPAYGDNCEKTHCQDNEPCLHDGVCTSLTVEPGFNCDCVEVFRGEHCEIHEDSRVVGRLRDEITEWRTNYLKYQISAPPTIEAWIEGSKGNYTDSFQITISNVTLGGFTSTIRRTDKKKRRKWKKNKEYLTLRYIVTEDWTAPKVDCECNRNGTSFPIRRRCRPWEDGQFAGTCASCKPTFGGKYCDECEPGYMDFPNCRPCDCGESYRQRYRGGTDQNKCDQVTGACICKSGFAGVKCDRCAPGHYYSYPHCKPCQCSDVGSIGPDCGEDEENFGVCSCKDEYTGWNCGRCKRGYFGYPNCRACECEGGVGFSSNHTYWNNTCDEEGVCICREGYTGSNCDSCEEGYIGYPNCRATDATSRKPHFEDCAGHFDYGGETRDGVYTIYPGGDPIEVFCEMSSGGSIVIQKRFDGSLNFSKTFEEYCNGFGDLAGEHWLGLNHVQHITSIGHWNLRFDFQDFQGEKRYAEYSEFHLGAAPGFALLFDTGSYRGDAGQYSSGRDLSLVPQHGSKFSTSDRDQDDWEDGNSAAEANGGGGFWYAYNNKVATTGMPYGNISHQSIVWYAWHGSGNLKSATLKIKRVYLGAP